MPTGSIVRESMKDYMEAKAAANRIALVASSSGSREVYSKITTHAVWSEVRLLIRHSELATDYAD